MPYQARVQTQDVVGVFFVRGYGCLALAWSGELEVLAFSENLWMGFNQPRPGIVRVFLPAQDADHVEHARLACRRNPDVAVVADPGAGFDWC